MATPSEVRRFPVAGGGSVVHHEPHRHADGRVTQATSHYAPDGRFLGITEFLLRPDDAAVARGRALAMSPEANLRWALAYMRDVLRRDPWRPWLDTKPVWPGRDDA